MIRAFADFMCQVRLTRIVQRHYALKDPRYRPMPFLTVVYLTLRHGKIRSRRRTYPNR